MTFPIRIGPSVKLSRSDTWVSRLVGHDDGLRWLPSRPGGFSNAIAYGIGVPGALKLGSAPRSRLVVGIERDLIG
jgi:hypothetical protein